MLKLHFTKIIDLMSRKPSNMLLNFNDFTYSKFSHFRLFAPYAVELYGTSIIPEDCELKKYQDLLIYSFIKRHVKKGAKILEVGGGDSRILRSLCNTYECWNLDKFEGIGNGPTSINPCDYTIVKDYIGSFSNKIPDNYFDFTFSISVFEHIKEETSIFNNILFDLDRIMKHKAMSLHCFDILLRNEKVWSNQFLNFIFQSLSTKNTFIPFDLIPEDRDVYYMSESAYYASWEPIVKKPYLEFGKPVSYNVLWSKI